MLSIISGLLFIFQRTTVNSPRSICVSDPFEMGHFEFIFIYHYFINMIFYAIVLTRQDRIPEGKKIEINK